MALYLSTYTDANVSMKKYYNSLPSDSQQLLIEFISPVVDEEVVDKDFERQMDDLDAYRAAMKRVVNGDTRIQIKMMSIRKFFSLPWLICPDQLIRQL